MRKLILSATLLLSVATFAQKDELKNLKKIFEKEKIVQKDIENYKSNLNLLEPKISNDIERLSFSFYKMIYPIVELNSNKANLSLNEYSKIFTPDYINLLSDLFDQVTDYEIKSGEKSLTASIVKMKSDFKPLISEKAFKLNSESKFKESSSMFYSLYKLDKSEGINLENAAMLSYQAQDYIKAEFLFAELLSSEYLKSGKVFFATNKLSGKEENFPSKPHRDKMVSLSSHEKPRDEDVILKKPEYLKMYAELVAYNGNLEKAKDIYKEAILLNPNDIEMLINESKLYYQTNDLNKYQELISIILKKDPNNAVLNYNLGFILLSDDAKIVDEINSNLKNKIKYDELVLKRKKLFEKALPYFEKSYSIDPKNENTKNVLKITYETLGQPEKAKAIN